MRRLRWRCRRGLLENEIILGRFLARHGTTLDRERLEALNELLDLSDNELWDLVAGRTEATLPRHREMVSLLRGC